METKIPLTPNALTVLEKRYLLKDEEKQIIETPEQLFRRVANAIASAETRFNPGADAQAFASDFYQMMAGLEFLPNTPTLMNAGTPLGQLSACFVLPIEDNLESIFNTLRDAALIHKSGGGTGFSFSRLRPEGDIVRSTRGVASGPLSFLTIFDAATTVMKQGGTRRGANMGVLRIDHPDIEKFINAKKDEGKLRSFNLSVAITEAFMKAFQQNGTYALVNPRTGQKDASRSAREIFHLITEAAWETGDPGALFLDLINRYNPTSRLGQMEATNPCGEQPLLPYESCNLGSINLSKMLTKQSDGSHSIDWDRLAKLVGTAVRFLDDVVEVNKYPLPQIDTLSRGNRKIGLGVMGFADMLIRLDVPYDSEQALKIADDVMSFIANESHRMSEKLAQERGPFPNFAGSRYDVPGGKPLRNATVTTIAPTGSISIIAGCSSGIEPLFALAFERHVLEGVTLTDVHPLFVEMARSEGIFTEELMDHVKQWGSLRAVGGIPEKFRRLFRTALEIPYEWHIEMQAVFQNHTDNAVSKTINLPPTAKSDDIEKAYLMAYNKGCKGITVYRYGTREQQVLTIQQQCASCTWDGVHTEETAVL